MLNYDLSIFQVLSIGIFGFLLGSFETTTNLFYLLTKNYDLPRKQHGKELPDNATEAQILHKVVQMFGLGLILLMTATIAIIIAPQLFIVGATAIFVNGLIDYGKFKKSNMLGIWAIIATIVGMGSLITVG